MPITDGKRQTDVPGRSTRVTFACVALLGLGCFVLGWAGTNSTWIEQSVNKTGQPPLSDNAGQILLMNVSTALLLFSGVATLGLGSVVSMGLVSAFVGASMRAVTSNLGMLATLEQSAPYMFIEFTGVTLAGTAGLIPVVAGLRATFTDDAQSSGFTRTYLAAVPRTMQVFGCAIVLILAAGAIEAVL